MKHSFVRNCAIALAFAAQMASSAIASPVAIPGSTSFGPLPGATFGGTGIPNHAVAITTVQDQANTITLGMTAFQRYANPPVGNNGNGDFYATVGLNDGLDFPSHPLGATWGYGIYIDVAGGGHLGDYDFSLLYDINPASANDESTHGVILLTNAFFLGGLSGLTHFEDAQNLYSSFFSTGVPFVVLAPGGTFNPFAVGEYTFSLRVTKNSNVSGEANIRVNVNTVPEPSAFEIVVLVLVSMFGFAAVRRQRVA